MNIDDSSKMDTLFKDLNKGDVFMYAFNYFMKITRIRVETGIKYNTVNLRNGEALFFDDYESVAKIRAKVVVE